MTGQNQNTPVQPDRKEGSASMAERLVFGALGGVLVWRAVTHPTALNGALGVAGLVMLLNAARGYSPYDAATNIRLTEDGWVDVRETVSVNRSARDVYDFWRDLSNLPKFMPHLQDVWEIDSRRSYWVDHAPAGANVVWEAEITADEPGRRLAWRTVDGAQIPNRGEVQFHAWPGGDVTEVRVRLQYRPPGGTLGAGVARLFGEEPSQQVRDALRELKRLLEDPKREQQVRDQPAHQA